MKGAVLGEMGENLKPKDKRGYKCKNMEKNESVVGTVRGVQCEKGRRDRKNGGRSASVRFVWPFPPG